MTWIVYTDLDGTLLDHDSYRFDAALSELNLLKQAGIAVIIVTSKTRAEVEPLWQQLALNAPFVVENGSAVYAPLASEWVQIDWQAKDGFAYKAFAPEIDQWQPLFLKLANQFPNQFTRFTQLDASVIAQLTGLSLSDSALAATREFSDPIVWQGSASNKQAFIAEATRLGCEVVAGGRFIHLLKGSDKGKAVTYLNGLAKQRCAPGLVKSVALGDGGNDISMLEAVDYPVRVRSLHHEFPKLNHANIYSTQGVGPTGWAEAVRQLILPSLQTEERG